VKQIFLPNADHLNDRRARARIERFAAENPGAVEPVGKGNWPTDIEWLVTIWLLANNPSLMALFMIRGVDQC